MVQRKAPLNVSWIEKHNIWSKADEFRAEHWPSNKLPVDVLDIVEFELEMEIIPSTGLKEDFDVDALLCRDWAAILVDSRSYGEEKFQNRLRFSIAHELGHFVLHKNAHPDLVFNSAKEWAEYMKDIPDYDYGRLEFQANEFAGRLLVPRADLDQHLKLNIEAALRQGLSMQQLQIEDALGYIATSLCRPFGVSDQVLMRRLRNEGLWPLEL